MTRAQVIATRRDELLTVGEFAALMRCSEKTIYRRIWKNQQLGAEKFGGQWRIDLAKVVQSCPIDNHTT
jgi:excisionase family DNA binding protein